MNYTIIVSEAQLQAFQMGLSFLPEDGIVEEGQDEVYNQTVAHLMELIDVTLECENTETTVHSFVP
jgi:hypothetical protein